MPEITQIILRGILAYFSLLILTRLMGKREISQMTFFDYVVGITIGSITQTIITDTTRPFYVLLPALIIFAVFQIISAYISLKSKTFRNIVEGQKTILIEKGKILEQNMRKERLNIDDLQSQLRTQKIFNLADVEFAYLETDGKISVMKKSDKQPVTPSDLNLQVKSNQMSQMVIEEGKINEQVLRQNNLTKDWLQQQLKAKGINQVSDVIFAQIDSNGTLFVDLYDNKNMI